eukprot:4800986-Prymnesium_polylepis.1
MVMMLWNLSLKEFVTDGVPQQETQASRTKREERGPRTHPSSAHSLRAVLTPRAHVPARLAGRAVRALHALLCHLAHRLRRARHDPPRSLAAGPRRRRRNRRRIGRIAGGCRGAAQARAAQAAVRRAAHNPPRLIP